MHYDKRQKLRCLVRGKKEFPVRADKRVTFNIKGRCDFDQDLNQVWCFCFLSGTFFEVMFLACGLCLTKLFSFCANRGTLKELQNLPGT